MSATGDENTTVTAARNQFPIDWERREPVSFAVQAALVELEDCTPTELAPLADYVDPDAIEAFFSGPPADVATRSLTFEYEGYTVHVDGSGRVCID